MTSAGVAPLSADASVDSALAAKNSTGTDNAPAAAGQPTTTVVATLDAKDDINDLYDISAVENDAVLVEAAAAGQSPSAGKTATDDRWMLVDPTRSPRHDDDEERNERKRSDGDDRRRHSPEHRPVVDTAAGSGRKLTTRLFVGNIPYDVRHADLKEFMSSAGEVISADVLMEPSGRSKGCGVVEYATVEEAQRAIETMNEKMFSGRPVFVREDREEPRSGRSTLPITLPPPPGGQLFIGNLPYSTDWREIKDLFRQAGPVIRADILETSDRRSRGCGIVIFESASDARYAIRKFDGFEIGGRRIEVREDRMVDSGRRDDDRYYDDRRHDDRRYDDRYYDDRRYDDDRHRSSSYRDSHYDDYRSRSPPRRRDRDDDYRDDDYYYRRSSRR